MKFKLFTKQQKREIVRQYKNLQLLLSYRKQLQSVAIEEAAILQSKEVRA